MQRMNSNVLVSGAAFSLALLAGVMGAGTQASALSFDYRDLTVHSGQTEAVTLGDTLHRGESAIFRVRQVTGGHIASKHDGVDIVLPKGCRVVETEGAAGLTISHDGGRTFSPMSAEPSEALRVPAPEATTRLRWRNTTAQPTLSGAVLVIARAE